MSDNHQPELQAIPAALVSLGFEPGKYEYINVSVTDNVVILELL